MRLAAGSCVPAVLRCILEVIGEDFDKGVLLRNLASFIHLKKQKTEGTDGR